VGLKGLTNRPFAGSFQYATRSGFYLSDQMVSIGLAAYLTLATLFSPWLCCCTATPAATPIVTDGAAPRHSGCHCQVVVRSNASSLQHQTPCDEHPCPAKHYLAQPVIIAAYSQSVAESAGQVFLLDFTDSVHRSASSTGRDSDDAVRSHNWESISFPFLSGRDVLCMIQIMRC
jgi:hypothetical protein